MKLDWMGRYREFIRLLIKYCNQYSRTYSQMITDSFGVSLSAQQWQVLECIIEFEDGNYNMLFLAKQLGLPKSTFSKYAKALVENGLVDKYQQADNHKNIILKPSAKGYVVYQTRSSIILEAGWKEPFAVLENLSDDSLKLMVEFMSKMVADQDPENNKVMNLIKLS